MPLPSLISASSTTPCAGPFGWQRSSSTSVSRNTRSSNSSTPSFFNALTPIMAVSPPHSSGTRPSLVSDSLVRWRLASGLSVFVNATTTGTLAARAWASASSVEGMGPSSAATTSTTMSTAWAPRARICVNAEWPGVSMIVNWWPALVCTEYAPMCCVMPPASPEATLELRMESINVVLPWSTWPRMATVGARAAKSSPAMAVRFCLISPRSSVSASTSCTTTSSMSNSPASSTAVSSSSSELMFTAPKPIWPKATLSSSFDLMASFSASFFTVTGASISTFWPANGELSPRPWWRPPPPRALRSAPWAAIWLRRRKRSEACVRSCDADICPRATGVPRPSARFLSCGIVGLTSGVTSSLPRRRRDSIGFFAGVCGFSFDKSMKPTTLPARGATFGSEDVVAAAAAAGAATTGAGAATGVAVGAEMAAGVASTTAAAAGWATRSTAGSTWSPACAPTPATISTCSSGSTTGAARGAGLTASTGSLEAGASATSMACVAGSTGASATGADGASTMAAGSAVAATGVGKGKGATTGAAGAAGASGSVSCDASSAPPSRASFFFFFLINPPSSAAALDASGAAAPPTFMTPRASMRPRTRSSMSNSRADWADLMSLKPQPWSFSRSSLPVIPASLARSLTRAFLVLKPVPFS